MKGNILIGQSGGPTSVINASLAGAVEGVLEAGARGKIFGMQFGIEGFLEDRLIDLGALSSDERKLLALTPSSALGSCRYKLKDDDLPVILERLKKQDIRYLFLAGGNDTMDTIHRIEAFARKEGYELYGVGIPKTVDNDLFGTDHTPGYGSAARYTALSLLQSGQLARDMQRVDRFVIHQTVGREAGWLAASSIMAKQGEGDAPHLIYLPERPLSREQVLKDVQECIKAYGFCSIVCGEGIIWRDGTPVSASAAKDGFSNIEFGAMGGTSAAISLHQLIHEETGYRGEFQITESLSMCADDRASATDRSEAFSCGLEAARLAASGGSGSMICMERLAGDYAVRYGTVPLSEVAVRAKPMPDHYINESGNGVTDAFLDYLRPLVGDMPKYQRLW
ncbi:diphosphate--fructose-6-phosphate 1-phosphotransferase [Sediminispirochaeta smaragdinae]|jgi:6-phosphofructokinase 1|uniref:Pyrophosphate--fructose 6-phosphate 1-phosphotransferase n=1 Tax=Sediminispirochaeta smaragdinae (strain DSM 11293 / JCM 15392 / SEBR 4228) TaxID=573413 RepID=E1R7E7_SEDSS|nr:diphosphate--fructose-6-phosphate 1-phosphotransferase [Sediminispirochaeta smaragdinae]ADK82652.1 phosphofructokinase [Sediminispirochaeta smaragdinae DSM 11293]